MVVVCHLDASLYLWMDMSCRFNLSEPGFLKLNYFLSDRGRRRDLGKLRALRSMIVTICAQLVLGCTTTRLPPTDFVLGIQGGPAQPPNSGTVKVYVHKV